MAVWMDCVDDRQPVPSWRGAVIAKITRLSAEEEDDEDDDDDFHRPPAATPAPAPRAPPPPAPPAPAPAPNIDIFGGPSPASHQSAPNTGNLFDHAPAPASGSGDLLGDMHGHSAYHGASSNNQSAAHSDFLGMTSPPASGGLTPQQQQQMQQQQQQQQQQQPMYGGPRAPPRHSGSFDSFGAGSQGGRSNDSNNAFGGLGTPWKN